MRWNGTSTPRCSGSIPGDPLAAQTKGPMNCPGRHLPNKRADHAVARRIGRLRAGYDRPAVCVTGQVRSFGEVGHNIREAVLLLLGPSIAFFGVRPRDDPWPLVQAMLPFTAVEEQKQCWGAAQLLYTIQWLHCDMRSRRHDCRGAQCSCASPGPTSTPGHCTSSPQLHSSSSSATNSTAME